MVRIQVSYIHRLSIVGLCIAVVLAVVLPRILHAETIYCLETRKQLVAELKEVIKKNADNSIIGRTLPSKILLCWDRNAAANARAEREIGPLLLRALEDSRTKPEIKRSCFRILEGLAPENIYREALRYWDASGNSLHRAQKESLLATIFRIRAKMANRAGEPFADSVIKNFVNSNRSLFDDHSRPLDSVIRALAMMYPFDYPQARGIDQSGPLH